MSNPQISGKYANILKNLVEEDTFFTSQVFNVNNKFIIKEELVDFETDISLSNYNIKDVGSISPCTEINVGSLSLNGHTINDSSGTNMLLNNVQKINNKALPSGDFFGTADQLTLQQIPNALITNEKIADSAITLPKIASISANSLLGNNTLNSATPIPIGKSDIKTMLDLSGTNSGDQQIKLQGDVSGIGYGTFNTTINSNAVTLSKMAQLPPSTIIGNNTGSTFTPSALTISQVKTMLSLTGSNSGDQTIVLSGDVSGTGTGSISTTIGDGSITNTKLATNSVSLDKIANISTGTILGNKEIGSQSPVALSISQVKTMLGLSGNNTGDQIITLTGDVTGFGTGSFAATIADGAVVNAKLGTKSVTLDKITNIGASTLMGNNAAGNQSPSALSIADVKTMLNLSGTNSGDQTITLTGDVTGSGTGSFAATIGSGSVTLAKMANLAANSIIGNNTASSTTPVALTASQVKSLLLLNNVENTALSTWAGSANITTIANNSVSLSNMAALAANSIIGNNTASSATPIALSASQVKTLLSLNNVENTALSTYSGNVGNITIDSGGSPTDFSLNGTNSAHTRSILWKNSGTKRMEMGLNSAYFFIYDSVLLKDVFRYTLGGGANPIKLPNYTSIGTLSISATDGTVTSASDRRLKQNEEALDSAISLQQIINLQPKKYTWKSDIDNRTRIGFIAQDVETILPDAIDGKKFEYEFIRDGAGPGVDGEIRVDENGNPILDYNHPRYRGLDQCAILSTLVSAVQELAKKNILLEERIAQLENH
jgi:hypothetical protein